MRAGIAIIVAAASAGLTAQLGACSSFDEAPADTDAAANVTPESGALDASREASRACEGGRSGPALCGVAPCDYENASHACCLDRTDSGAPECIASTGPRVNCRNLQQNCMGTADCPSGERCCQAEGTNATRCEKECVGDRICGKDDDCQLDERCLRPDPAHGYWRCAACSIGSP